MNIHLNLNWYDKSRQAVEAKYGDDTTLFCGLLAATSANSRLKSNATLAIKAYHQIKDTGSVSEESFMQRHYKSINSVLDTGLPRGIKCRAFYRALLGDVNSVVVDIWIARYYGLYVPRGLTRAQYHDLAQRIREEAIECGMYPRDYQAMIWCRIRGNGDSYAEYI